MKLAMIPARMGSQRLKNKNLQLFNGIPLITHAIRRCKEASIFDQIWVNSEDETFHKIANEEGVFFHKRPKNLANNQATSEDFIYEFLKKHDCERLFQVHSIAPLLSHKHIKKFVEKMISVNFDVQLSCVHENIECAYKDSPVNFSFENKVNSQDLKPVQKITWSITGWKRDVYIKSYEDGQCATYSGKKGFYEVDRKSGHVIKTLEDLKIAEMFSKL